jgi:hypothetical protein
MHYTPSVDLAFVSVEHIINNTLDCMSLIPTVLARLKGGMLSPRPMPKTKADKGLFLQ